MTTSVEAPIERHETALKFLHNTQVSIEKARIAVGNRVKAIERGVDGGQVPMPETYTSILGALEAVEAEIDAAIKDELTRWPVWDLWLRHVRGIGPSLAGQMLALLLPPRADKGPSSWFKAAGLAPELRPDGMMRLPRARAGEGKITYHPWLRRCLHNVAHSFVLMGGYYRQVYEQKKAALVAKHTGDADWPPHRLDSVARWSMLKVFLGHTWEAWCEADGIPNRGPYIVALHPEHHYIPRPLPDGKAKI